MVLAGCGANGEQAARTIEDAVAKTTRSGPLALSQTATLELGPEETVTMVLDGVADGRARTVRARLDVKWSGPGDAPRGPAKELSELDGDIAEAKDRLYLRLASVDRDLDLDGRWIVLDPRDPIARQAGFTGSSGIGALDSTRPVDHLRAAEAIERVGEDRGATRYRMTIDYDRYLDLIGAKRRKALAPELAKLSKATRTDRHPLDAWIDGEGRIVRIQGRIRTVLGRDLVNYTLDMEPARRGPVIPRDALTFQDLRAR